MSSGSNRGIPSGVIRQGNKVVGCIVLPDEEEIFVREFNHCYGQLRLSVAPIPEHPTTKPITTDPYTFQIPTWFRHVWHAAHPREDSLPASPPVPAPAVPAPPVPASPAGPASGANPPER